MIERVQYIFCLHIANTVIVKYLSDDTFLLERSIVIVRSEGMY